MAALPKGPTQEPETPSAEFLAPQPSPTCDREGGETLPRPLAINYGVETRHFKKYGYEIVVFIREYIKDLSAPRAAEVAWPAKLIKKDLAYSALHDPEICGLIDAALDAKRQKFEIEEGILLRTLAHRAYARMGDYISVQADGTAYVDLSKASPDQLAAVAELNTEEVIEGRDEDARNIRKIKIKLHNPDKPAELLMRKLGLLREESTTTVNVLVGIAERLADAKKELEEK